MNSDVHTCEIKGNYNIIIIIFFHKVNTINIPFESIPGITGKLYF